MTRSSEFAFVCACAGLLDPPCAGVDTLDGEKLAAIAHRHQVVPLVVEALKRCGKPIPPALTARFDPLRPLRMAREAIRLRTLLMADGIEPLFLKGSSLAVLAYGAIGRRQFSDIDLLVRPVDAGRAAIVLGGAGYQMTGQMSGQMADRIPGTTTTDLAERIARLSPLAKDIELYHPGNGQIVELHWRMTDNLRERPIWGREAIQWVDLAPGAALPTLGTEALFAYICGHGAAHLWARLRWLADVAALLAREPDGGDAFWRGAVMRGQGRAAASAILLANRLFAIPLPPAFSRPWSLRLVLLLWASHRVIAAGGGTTELSRTRWRGWAEMVGKLLVVANVGDLTGWFVRLLFSVSNEETIGNSRSWYVLHPLQRIPKLLRRRRLRRANRNAAISDANIPHSP